MSFGEGHKVWALEEHEKKTQISAIAVVDVLLSINYMHTANGSY